MMVSKNAKIVQFDGEKYVLALPPNGSTHWIRTRNTIYPGVYNDSWESPCATAHRLESELATYQFITNPTSNFMATLTLQQEEDPLKVNPVLTLKDIGVAEIGFRPCLVPIDKTGRYSLLPQKENPNGVITEGGTLLIKGILVDPDAEPKRYTGETLDLRFEDSQIGKQNLRWIIVEGLLICADILFFGINDTFAKNELFLYQAEEYLFMRTISPHV